MRRALVILCATALWIALLAPAALASDNGEGLYGETSDKVVTNAGFVLIAFFPLFLALMSYLQWRLDKRKKARRAAAQGRLSRPEWHGGW